MRHVNTKDAQKNAAENPKVLVNNMHHCSDSYQNSKVLTLTNVCISACTYVCHDLRNAKVILIVFKDMTILLIMPALYCS